MQFGCGCAAVEATQLVAGDDRFHLRRLLDATQRLQPGARPVQPLSKARRSRDDAHHLRRLSYAGHVVGLRQPVALRLVQRQFPQRVSRYCRTVSPMLWAPLSGPGHFNLRFQDVVQTKGSPATRRQQHPHERRRRWRMWRSGRRRPDAQRRRRTFAAEGLLHRGRRR